MSRPLIMKRMKQQKTNYRKRERLLAGRRDFVSVHISSQNVSAQLLRPNLGGDISMASVHSKELISYGWKASRKNLPTCYLVGLLLGRKSLSKGIKTAVLYTAKRSFNSRISACIKGIIDSGMEIPFSEEVIPPESRLNGTHIASYAKDLKSDERAFKSKFSGMLNNGLNPELFPSHFLEVKTKIDQSTHSESINKASITIGEEMK